MKSEAKKSLYFSAYPLKAIQASATRGSSSSHTPYLRSVLTGKVRPHNKVRVFPMADPYKQTKQLPKKVNPPKNVEGSGNEWYNHYE